jgi:hypothetical protein
MIPIRTEQNLIFLTKAEAEFESWLLNSLLRDLLPSSPELTADEIKIRLLRSFQLAQEFGLESRAEKTRFAYLYVAIAPSLESEPEFEWMRHILRGPAPGKLKLDQIEMGLEATDAD